MAGHSKWAQIKRQKGVADQRRGAAFGKLANAITVAARGGADPEMNFQLRIAIDRAKAANMPKDNIERAIQRASGSDAAAMEEIIFEAYGPDGTAFIIETATDNRNRTVGEVRAALNKYGGKLAETGSVGYLFKRHGFIAVSLDSSSKETVELAAIEADASDVQFDDTVAVILTDPQQLQQVRQALPADLAVEEVGFEWEPTATIKITDAKTAERVLKLAEVLDEIDDVTKVSSNFEIAEDLVQ